LQLQLQQAGRGGKSTHRNSSSNTSSRIDSSRKTVVTVVVFVFVGVWWSDVQRRGGTCVEF
ncbi:hypothetical protein, partial [Xanthomonas phaseoli]|uniref:hypothetical protein n=1 Tax=Xanthomonas phaseoli TaxID=1985254 RepID=UPI001969E2B2